MKLGILGFLRSLITNLMEKTALKTEFIGILSTSYEKKKIFVKFSSKFRVKKFENLKLTAKVLRVRVYVQFLTLISNIGLEKSSD